MMPSGVTGHLISHQLLADDRRRAGLDLEVRWRGVHERWRAQLERLGPASSLRALLWVAPLTLLILIYAEREQQASGTARFQIVVKSADPTQIATFVSATYQNVMATLKIVDRAIIIKSSRVVFDGTSQELASNKDLWQWF